MLTRLLAVSLFAALAGVPAGAQSRPVPNVLVIMSYHPGNDWTGEIVRGLSQTMSDPGVAEIWVEYLDARRRNGPARFDEFENQLGALHAGRRFSAVAACDDYAFQFLRDRGERLFPATPFAFCGIDQPMAATAAAGRFTGVLELYDFQAVTGAIRRLHPHLRRILLVHDGGAAGLTLCDGLLPFLTAPPALEVVHLDSRDLPLARIAQRLAAAQPEEAAVVTALAQDRDHPYLDPVETYTLLGANARLPLYTLTYSVPGRGILAASENRGFQHGVFLARILQRLLAGERIAAIDRIRDSFTPLLFDYAELRRQGLSLNLVKSPDEIVNRPVSFYDEYRWWIWGGALFFSLQAVAIAILVSAVHRRRQAESVLRDALRQSHEAAEMKSRFLANVSHELRTPLHGILGLSKLLEAGGLVEPQREYNRQIINCTRGLSSIVNDLLDLAQLENGRLRIEPGPFELRPFLTEIVGFFRPRATELGIELNLSVDSAVPAWVLGLPGRVRQVLTNLIGNAMKFTSSGSIQVRVAPAAGGLRFEVADTGSGIPPAQQSLIFEPFRQADSSSTRQVEGAGLGLAISRQLVERMGGRIGLESAPGRGSTFWFELPLPQTPGPIPSPAAETAPRPRLDGRRVLVVEDNNVNLLLLRRVLEQAGCEVQAAHNGAEAIDQVEHGGRFDLILMDVHMPVMSGLDATRAIRRLDSSRRIPVVALTASAALEDRLSCLDSGMDDFLTKPIEPAVMLAGIDRWLSRS